MREKLLKPKIGKWGQLQEWMEDRDESATITATYRTCSRCIRGGRFRRRRLRNWPTPRRFR